MTTVTPTAGLTLSRRSKTPGFRSAINGRFSDDLSQRLSAIDWFFAQMKQNSIPYRPIYSSEFSA
jgi:predicted fused transcriptional regulator/phosphomethylpyrimidine kinase